MLTFMDLVKKHIFWWILKIRPLGSYLGSLKSRLVLYSKEQKTGVLELYFYATSVPARDMLNHVIGRNSTRS